MGNLCIPKSNNEDSFTARQRSLQDIEERIKQKRRESRVSSGRMLERNELRKSLQIEIDKTGDVEADIRYKLKHS